MADHLTEEEQLERLKSWWRENGRSTIIGVVVAVAAYFGWGAWKNHQEVEAEAASVLYSDLLEAVQVAPGETLTEEKRTTAVYLAGQLKEAHSGNLYAQNAALILARLAVEQNELDKAEEELRWVLDHNPTPGIEQVTRLRLARVLQGQKAYDKALALLERSEVEANFQSAYAEARGDALVGLERVQEARAAYQLALEKLPQEQGSRRALLQMKMDDLAPREQLASAEATQ